jgi:TonB family protein
MEESLNKRRGTGTYAQMSAKVKKALAANRGWARPGNQEPLGNRRQIFYRYIKMIHEKRIHPIFGHGFWESLPSLGAAHPLNDMSLHTLAEFEILQNGAVNEVRVVKTSGNTVFDAAAVDSVYRGSPFPPPPKQILSWNGRVYLKWGFYRSRRMCGVFNVEPYILKAPGSEKEEIQIDDFIQQDQQPQLPGPPPAS